MRTPEFRPGGPYSLLTDKGNGVLARLPNGKKIMNMSGGCDETEYCNNASIPLKLTIGIVAYLTGRNNQKIYRDWINDRTVIINSNKHAELNPKPAIPQSPLFP